jgi:putative SOS response-associated peptidase YedK
MTRKKDWYWFGLDDTQPLFAFAGLWCDWYGIRGTKKEPVDGQHRLYAFLTTEANGVVQPVHSKAMPAVLTTPEEFEAWLSVPIEEALRLQRPLPDEALQIVGMGREGDDLQPSQFSLMQMVGRRTFFRLIRLFRDAPNSYHPQHGRRPLTVQAGRSCSRGQRAPPIEGHA